MSYVFGQVTANDENLQGKSASSKFGLNPSVFVTTFGYNGNAGKEGAEGEAFDLRIKVGDREQSRRIFKPSKVWGKDGAEIKDTSSAEYTEGINEDYEILEGVIMNVLNALGVSDQQVKDIFSKAKVTDFQQAIKTYASLLPNNFESIPVDLFMEYEWEIRPNQERTYPIIPKNLKGGPFLCAHVAPQGGSFKEVREGDGTLKYVDGAGNEHPFTRDATFMESKKGYQQGDTNNTPSGSGTVIANTQNQATW